MKGKEQKDSAAPTPDADARPFFARFLEDQHGDAEAKAVECMTLKYPSDRDEDDVYSPPEVEAAATNYEPSRRTLKYPSDRDDIDPPFVVPHGNSAGAS
ncbi:MAG TPA: microviridin/marinostatin family tricyclic proteinase inhibitor [Pyrinomonadaceae bacterium]|nr:microviridin/marinostatin family tricyclic proteinase inhibitor [Pyrinomonadaceae bacterium]